MNLIAISILIFLFLHICTVTLVAKRMGGRDNKPRVRKFAIRSTIGFVVNILIYCVFPRAFTAIAVAAVAYIIATLRSKRITYLYAVDLIARHHVLERKSTVTEEEVDFDDLPDGVKEQLNRQ